MFVSFFGVSFLFHLTVIGLATILNRFAGRQHQSAFQTYGKQGGWFRNRLANVVSAYIIAALLISYVFATLLFVMYSAARFGADDFPLAAIKWLVAGGYGVAVELSSNQYFLMTVGFGFGALALVIAVQGVLQLAQVSRARVYAGATAAMLTIVTSLRVLAIVLLGTLFAVPAIAGAQIVEPGFESEVVAGNFSLPTAVAFAPDGRIFVAEKNGVVKVVKNGTVLPTPVITLTDINTFGDRGLLGMAVDPNFASNGYLYLSYTFENTPGNNPAAPKTGRIVRVTVTGDTASEATKVVLVGSVGGDVTAPSCEDYAVTADCIASDSNSHSMGALTFGPDGMLYASTGDGADFADIDTRAFRAQNIDALAGKVLRIDPATGAGLADNPFFNGDVNANRSKVYAYGFRNQYRLTFNTVTGRLYGGDVGWSDWEEVNDIVSGGNYGWPCREGANDSPYGCANATADIDPLYAYPHNSAGAGSITIGAFATNDAYPDAYDTSLFIGDYAQQWIKRLVLNPDGSLNGVVDFQIGNFDLFPVDFETGTDGAVYYLDIAFGTLNRLTHTDGNRRPVVAASADVTSGVSPLTVTFDATGSTDPDGDALTYEWNFGDGSAVQSGVTVSHTYTTTGSYDAVVTVTDSNNAATTQSIAVTVGNQAPDATIDSPASGSLYDAGGMVMAMGSATDAEDGELPASAFEWTVLLHHNTHVHTLQQFSNTKMITFNTDDHNALDVYVEVVLTVTDSAGLTDTTSINMYLNNGQGGGNLIDNPSLETVDPNVSSQPLNWIPGWYGQMNPVFTYPAQGLSGNSAAELTVTGHVSGEARWYFAPVFVTPGSTYTFSHLYTATVDTSLTIQYTMTDGSNAYVVLAELPAVADPTTTNYDITIPAGVETMTIFHDMYQNGTVRVDEYSLTLAGATDTNPPTGTITNITDNQVLSGVVTVEIDATDAEGAVEMVHLYVDGQRYGDLEDTTAPFTLTWDTTEVADGTYVIRGHLHDEVDNHGLTPEVTVVVDNGTGVTPPISANLIQNGTFELAETTNKPYAWTAGGWGSHDRVLTYPVAGYNSDRAVRVEITDYQLSDTGDAKWRHDAVAVTPGTEYVFSTYYHSDTISDVIAQYTLADGNFVYQGIVKEIQPATDWTQAVGSTIAPAGAVSLTAFHLISAEGYLEIDDVSLVASSTGNVSETNAPYIAWDSHADGDEVSGVVTFTASSTDDTEVVGVYFGVNGTFTGSEDFTAPYTLTIDTADYPNGDYIMKATSHDVFGNNDVDEIVVTFNNNATVPPVTDNNLVVNGGFDALDVAGFPVAWREGGYGINDNTYSVVTTAAGNNVAYVEIFNYVSGDAKWVFDDVAVIAGETYEYSIDYASRNNNEVVAYYRLTDGTYRAELIDYAPAYDTNDPADLTTYTASIVIPADAEAVSIFHTPLVVDVNQPSYAYIDNVTLTGEAPVDPVDPPTGDNLIVNADFAAVTAGTPDGWNRGGWGSNTADLDYQVGSGATGALDTVVADYVSGDAKWYFDDVAVTPGEEYTYSTTYQATVGSDLTARYTLTDGSVQYEYLAYVAPAATWTNSTPVTFTAPATAASVTVFHALAADGTLEFYNPTLTGQAPDPVVPVDPPVEPPTGDNLVDNGDFAIGSADTPTAWLQGGWGTNDAIFSYPVVGEAGDAARVEISNYVSGDAKWYFAPVAVVGGEAYSYAHSYRSDATTGVVAQYTLADGSVTYGFLATLAPAATWTQNTGTFTAPVEATEVTIFHTISTDGYLETDSWSVVGEAGDTPDPVTPVTPTPNPGVNVLSNGDFSNGDTDWLQGGWGDNTVAFDATAGIARLDMTAYTSGDAKWYFADVVATSSTSYDFALTYESDVAVSMIARYTITDGSIVYDLLDTAPAAATPTPYSVTLLTPADVATMTIFVALTGVGYYEIDEVSLMEG